ncbi:hypothetical protein CVT24_002859 [Panaeolus cyanescens]|uniref:Uncharacterized protein n=1 Tax=Panaeolus cyanescens TaxID=181874 RepID=A0A409VN23_9AGAR|nr:hypothetical protein CVT24_002859 [Panaeolus cyanescens]
MDPVIPLPTGTGQLDMAHSWFRPGQRRKCEMDNDKKEAICVEEWLLPRLTPSVDGSRTVPVTQTETITATFTGDLIPVATLMTGGSKELVTSNAAAVILLAVALGASMV